MFRGSAAAKIDEKGRLKIPSKFREPLRQRYGSQVFITSFGSPALKVYPLAEWLRIEKALSEGQYAEDPLVNRFLTTVGRWGDEQEVDAQGRLFIPQHIRKHTRMDGEVVVIGLGTGLLEVWNEEVLNEYEAKDPLTEEAVRYVSRIIREAKDGSGTPPRSGDGSGGG
ncbi:MAG: division/cell wall cluster transcriptional repressor MraZ [Acidobacteriota bacterium]